MGGIGREATEDNIVFKTKLQDFGGLKCSKSIGN